MYYLVRLDNDSVGILSIARDLAEEKKQGLLEKHTYKEVAELPETSYQKAWVCKWEDSEDNAVSIDMAVAKDIYRDKIRPERNKLLEQLDVEFMLALEQADTDAQSAIAARKQYLRDVTEHQSIIDATSIEELEALDLLSEEEA